METPTDYPLPSSAAYIWTNGDKIFMTFPGYKGNEDRRFNTVVLKPEITTSGEGACECQRCGKAQTVTVTVKNKTLEILWDILVNRANAAPEARKIGTRATPTQYNIDEMLKGMKATRIEKKVDLRNSSVDDILSKLDINFEDLS